MTSGLFVVTAAGEGSRFSADGKSVPKAAITAAGKSLLYWSMLGVADAIRHSWTVRVAVRSEHQLSDLVLSVAQELDLAMDIVSLDRATRGQAETALAATEDADGDLPVCIWNTDTLVSAGVVAEIPRANWLLCFPSDQPNLSYARINALGAVTEIAEKEVISPWATAGMYAFRSLAAFRAASHQRYEWLGDHSVPSIEGYVAPVYATLLKTESVSATVVARTGVIPLGTPAEVEASTGLLTGIVSAEPLPSARGSH